jgi:hypothetical protein
VVDNGTIAGRRGSLNVDDEGTATQETVLIEGGILRGYLTDKLSARLMKARPTPAPAAAKATSHIPMPRMTNTYMLAGDDAPEDILRSVKRGLYAVNFGGGQVDITNGKFVFSASEAYLIEDGKITAPVRDATLIGNGPEALKHVSMVGHDLKLDEGSRHLRQRRPERPGGRWHAHDQARQDDGRGNWQVKVSPHPGSRGLVLQHPGHKAVPHISPLLTRLLEQSPEPSPRDFALHAWLCTWRCRPPGAGFPASVPRPRFSGQKRLPRRYSP